MPRVKHWLVVLAVMVGVLAPTMVASAQDISEDEFTNTWERTDWPVANAGISRTWMWGPQPYTGVIIEEYSESPGGMREVQYFDKSRMEITDPNAVNDGLWYVTNGLLVNEMATGEMQVGDNDFVYRGPADVPVAGDADDIFGPTYETIGWNIEDGHTLSQGELITGVIDWLGYDPEMSAEVYDSLAAYGVTAAEYSPATGKYTASVFWEFMNSSALVYIDGQLVNAPLFENPYYATGLPIDQPWWADVKVGGTYKWVLVQCFERRCLTYTPDNPAGWQVEAGNVGQHYYTWRYESAPVDPPMGEFEYVDSIYLIDDQYLASLEYLDELLLTEDLNDPSWVQAFTAEMEHWRDLADQMYALNPPERYVEVHEMFLEAYDYIVDASYYFEEGAETQDEDLILMGWEAFETGDTLLDQAFDFFFVGLPGLTDEEYLDIIFGIDEDFLESADYLDVLWDDFDIDNPEWVDDVVAELEYWRYLVLLMDMVNPPDNYVGVHDSILEAYGLIWDASVYLEDGVIEQDIDLITDGWDAFYEAEAMLDDIFSTLSAEE